MYTTFYAELAQVQQRIADPQKFYDWCFDELHISYSIIENVAGILKKADADIIRQDLRAAKEAEQQRKKREQAEAAKAKAEAEKAEADAKAAKIAADQAAKKAAQEARKNARAGGVARGQAIAKHAIAEVQEAVMMEQLSEHSGSLLAVMSEDEQRRLLPIWLNDPNRRPRKTPEKKTAVAAQPQGSYPVPANAELADLLEQSRLIVKTSRIECGRLYTQMRELVQSGRAVKADGKPWQWGAWCAAYVTERSRQDINKCIMEFDASCDNSQNKQVDNVMSFPSRTVGVS